MHENNKEQKLNFVQNWIYPSLFFVTLPITIPIWFIVARKYLNKEKTIKELEKDIYRGTLLYSYNWASAKKNKVLFELFSLSKEEDWYKYQMKFSFFNNQGSILKSPIFKSITQKEFESFVNKTKNKESLEKELKRLFFDYVSWNLLFEL